MLRGINYDVGTYYRKDELSRPVFDEVIIQKEISIIRNELHCDAIKITGYDPDRLYKAAEFALEHGLQVWLMPSFIDASPEEALLHLLECASFAEELRKKYGNIIFIMGYEYSLFVKGFIKGDTIYQRMGRMFSIWGIISNIFGFRFRMHRKLNNLLKHGAEKIRQIFDGQVTYASGTWEKIDWSSFDFVGIDHYKAYYNKKTYDKQLEKYYRYNKPVVVMEFGCCAYKGAAEKGPIGWQITETENGKRVIKGDYIRDESEQADYIADTLDTLKNEKVFGAFVFTFINPMYKYSTKPREDLDMASYGIVKPVDGTEGYNGLPWLPKAAFYRLGAYYETLNH